jgi:hypothetical protein
MMRGVRYGGTCVRQTNCHLVPFGCVDTDHAAATQLEMPACAAVVASTALSLAPASSYTAVSGLKKPSLVALLLCGLSRGAFLPDGTWRGFARNVVRPLSSEACVLTFVCDGLPQPGQPQPTPAMRAQLQIVHEHYAATSAPMERLRLCWTVADAWARRHGVQVSFFLKARPDQVWHADVLPLSTLPSVAVSVRARTLVTARFNVSTDHMAWNGCGWDKSVCPSQAHRALDAGRECISIDDQWAVVPAHLAPGYFNGTKMAAVSGFASRSSDHMIMSLSTALLRQCGSCFAQFNEGELTAQLSAANVPINVAPFRMRVHDRFGTFPLPGGDHPVGHAADLACDKSCLNQPGTPCHSSSKFTRSVALAPAHVVAAHVAQR